MQLLLIARIFFQQIFRVKSGIQRQFAQIVSHQDKLQVCSLDSNSKHNWTKKTDAESVDRPYSPPTDFSRQGSFHSQFMQIVSSQDKHQVLVCSLDSYSNSKHNWAKKKKVASIIARIFLQQIFQGKAEIQSQFTQIFSHQDDHQVRS